MNEKSRIFDFLYYQLDTFPKEDMLCAKENGYWTKYSTKEVVALVNKLSAGLLKLGLGNNESTVDKQDKIAIISKNRPEWLMLDFACQQIGVILCPIYPTTNINEIEFIFNDAAIKYVFVSGEDCIEKMISLSGKIPSLINIYSFDSTTHIEHWSSIIKDVSALEIAAVNDIKKTIQAEACATIIYTSGTTGTPKGVMLSHKNIVSNVLNSTKSFPFPKMPTARALSFLPLNHIFERIASCIYCYAGISIYYAESMETIGDNLKEIKPALFTTVPRLLEKVFEKIMIKGAELKGVKRKLFYWAVSLAEKYDPFNGNGLFYNFQLYLANKIIFSKWRKALGGNVQYIITGGAACQLKLLKIFNAAKIHVYEGYGPTENSPVISVNCRKKNGTKFGTVGLVIEGQEVKLAADGEICVKGPSVMMGYYNRPDLTSEVLIDGWLHTGDIGVFENGCYLKITDRKKELFKTSGGKYVAPQPIENKIKESPFVEQILVVGADEKFVGALIVPSFNNLTNWLKEKEIHGLTAKEAIDHPQVLMLYTEILNSYNSFFNPVEQIKKFELIPVEWTIDTGELTPKLSMKRKVIMEKYNDSINKIYK